MTTTMPAIDRSEMTAPLPRPTIVFGLGLGVALLAGAVFLYCIRASSIAQWRFVDVDDIMRLQEVKDWLGGQSWFDVTQYRIDPPAGLKMHWSRLLDVPLAAVVLLLRPILGEIEAERAACVIVPLLTFATIALITAAIAWRVLRGSQFTLLAPIFCAFNIGVITIAAPMRIDHHGWQAACGLGMAWALLGPRTVRRAAIAGFCAALWMHISLEGIVFTAGCGAWLGVRWLLKPAREGATLPAYMAATAAGSLGFFLIAHGGALFDRTFCDAVSPVHMVVFALAAIGSAMVVRIAPATLPLRAVALGCVALACATIYKLWAPQCSGGPFTTLTPLTYQLWYQVVREGLPVWQQSAAAGLGWIAFPLVANIGAAFNIRNTPADQREMAVDYAAFLLLATAIGLVVCRAGAFSNILAVPGGLVLLRSALARVGTIRMALLRVLLSALAFIVIFPLGPVFLALTLAPADKYHAGPGGDLCAATTNLAHMNALPASTVLTTLVFSPQLIFTSHHKGVSAGYHRNVASMDDTLRFFTGDDSSAHEIMLRHHARYVLVCPGDGDLDMLADAAPTGLAARLPRGEAPPWLSPVTVPGLRYARVYAVNR